MSRKVEWNSVEVRNRSAGMTGDRFIREVLKLAEEIFSDEDQDAESEPESRSPGS